ncbi:SGNH/GDSL hydrolase family protein, partial [Methylobacterium frigidaeris]
VLLAQGDSWFDYPLTGNGLPLVDTDVIAQLRRIGPMPPTILNLAHHGDAAVGMMSLEKQSRMIAALRDPANWIDGKPDAILFSAGGNDIAGEQFCIFLDFNDGRNRGLNAARFDGALGMVEACYLALFAMRDRVSPGVPILAHCYDFPIPNGAHPPCAGPWLKPSLDFCNWSTAAGTAIVREALVAFRAMLARLASNAAYNFHLIDTQGTLSAAEWANELHPTPAGFAKIAKAVSAALDELPPPPARAEALAALAAPAAGQGALPAEPNGGGVPGRGKRPAKP